MKFKIHPYSNLFSLGTTEIEADEKPSYLVNTFDGFFASKEHDQVTPLYSKLQKTRKYFIAKEGVPIPEDIVFFYFNGKKLYSLKKNVVELDIELLVTNSRQSSRYGQVEGRDFVRLNYGSHKGKTISLTDSRLVCHTDTRTPARTEMFLLREDLYKDGRGRVFPPFLIGTEYFKAEKELFSFIESQNEFASDRRIIKNDSDSNYYYKGDVLADVVVDIDDQGNYLFVGVPTDWMYNLLEKKLIYGPIENLDILGNEFYYVKKIIHKLGLSECGKCHTTFKIDPIDQLPYCKKCLSYNISGYHSLSRGMKLRENKKAKYLVGFEVEKVDAKVLKKLSYLKTHYFYKWCLERDGSLGDDGFEAVSPVYDLFDTETIKSDFDQLDFLDARKDGRAGGHINLSKVDVNAKEFFAKELSGYMPLLYALYPKRSENSYCKAMPVNYYVSNPEKRQAANIKNSDIVELRIFPSPRNRRVLLWRLNLLQLMVSKPISIISDYGGSLKDGLETLIGILLDKEEPLTIHLMKVYNTPEKIKTKINMIMELCNKFEMIKYKNSDDLMLSVKNYDHDIKIEETDHIFEEEHEGNGVEVY